jgi:vacuolar-type H+-ATPase subunit C/Vma6
MLKAQLEYGAVHTKVMAMHGKMLKTEEWRRLAEAKNIAELAIFLRSHRGWSQTMAELPVLPTVPVLKAAVQRRVYEDYERLYKFLLAEDKKLLRFVMYRVEYAFILDTARDKTQPASLPKSLELTDFIRKHSTVDMEALEHSANFQGVLAAIRGSIYEKPLAELRVDRETGWPRLPELGIVLENTYFKAIFTYISRKYKGIGRDKLADTIGLEADLLNIISELRLHRSFRVSLEQAGELMIPVYYHLRPDFLTALTNAKTESETLDLLRKSPFKKYLEGADTANIESIYYNALEKFCKKLVTAPEPDISAALGYVILKDLECRKLNRIIEALACGYDPKNIL